MKKEEEEDTAKKLKIYGFIKDLFSFANLLLLATVVASVLSFYFSYYSGFDSVEQIRKTTQHQFASTLGEDVQEHVSKLTSFVHFTEVAIQQGMFSDMSGLQSLLELQRHLWQVFDTGYSMGYGLSSIYVGNDWNNFVGYSSDPACALVQYAGIEPGFFLLPVLDNAGTFNVTNMTDAAFYVSPFFDVVNWELYNQSKVTKKPVWTDLYIYEGIHDVVFLTFAYPVNYPNGSFCCTIFTDIVVAQFSSYLAAVPAVATAEGLAMILTPHGELIASSDTDQPALIYNPNSKNNGDRVLGWDVNNKALAEGGELLKKLFPDGFVNIPDVSAQIHTSDGIYFFHATTIDITFGNNTWILITMQPRKYYFSKIDRMQLLIIIFSCVSLGTGVIYRVLPVLKRWWLTRHSIISSIPGNIMCSSSATWVVETSVSMTEANRRNLSENEIENESETEKKEGSEQLGNDGGARRKSIGPTPSVLLPPLSRIRSSHPHPFSAPSAT